MPVIPPPPPGGPLVPNPDPAAAAAEALALAAVSATALITAAAAAAAAGANDAETVAAAIATSGLLGRLLHLDGSVSERVLLVPRWFKPGPGILVPASGWIRTAPDGQRWMEPDEGSVPEQEPVDVAELESQAEADAKAAAAAAAAAAASKKGARKDSASKNKEAAEKAKLGTPSSGTEVANTPREEVSEVIPFVPPQLKVCDGCACCCIFL